MRIYSWHVSRPKGAKNAVCVRVCVCVCVCVCVWMLLSETIHL
jgi:hypothetical protein